MVFLFYSFPLNGKQVENNGRQGGPFFTGTCAQAGIGTNEAPSTDMLGDNTDRLAC